MNVLVTVLTLPAGEAELGADRLTGAGAFAIEERSTDSADVESRAVLGDSESASVQRLGELPATWSLHVERVESTALDTWREFVAPMIVADDLVLRPAWLPSSSALGTTEVVIEPGSTFGLGDHPTTRLSAAAVWRSAGDGDAMLDVGSGSGVLAIVALLAGAARATAIDISESSPAVVIDNARRNGVGDRIEASTAPLDQIEGTFDVVAANILAPELIALAADLRRVTAGDGVLVVSGVLADRHEHVLAALAPMEVVRTDVLDGWAAIELCHGQV